MVKTLNISRTTKEKIVDALNDLVPLLELDVLEDREDIGAINLNVIYDKGFYNYSLVIFSDNESFVIKL